MEAHQTNHLNSEHSTHITTHGRITHLANLEQQCDELKEELRPLTVEEIDAMAKNLLARAESTQSDQRGSQQLRFSQPWARRAMKGAGATMLAALVFFGGYRTGVQDSSDTANRTDVAKYHTEGYSSPDTTTYLEDVAGNNTPDKLVRYEAKNGFPAETYVIEVDGTSTGFHGQYPRLNPAELAAYPRTH